MSIKGFTYYLGSPLIILLLHDQFCMVTLLTLFLLCKMIEYIRGCFLIRVRFLDFWIAGFLLSRVLTVNPAVKDDSSLKNRCC